MRYHPYSRSYYDHPPGYDAYSYYPSTPYDYGYGGGYGMYDPAMATAAAAGYSGNYYNNYSSETSATSHAVTTPSLHSSTPLSASDEIRSSTTTTHGKEVVSPPSASPAAGYGYGGYYGDSNYWNYANYPSANYHASSTSSYGNTNYNYATEASPANSATAIASIASPNSQLNTSSASISTPKLESPQNSSPTQQPVSQPSPQPSASPVTEQASNLNRPQVTTMTPPQPATLKDVHMVPSENVAVHEGASNANNSTNAYNNVVARPANVTTSELEAPMAVGGRRPPPPPPRRPFSLPPPPPLSSKLN